MKNIKPFLTKVERQAASLTPRSVINALAKAAKMKGKTFSKAVELVQKEAEQAAKAK